MSINREPVDWFDERLEWSCASGATRLDEMLRTGFFYLRWDILDADRQVVASTEWRAVELATGTTTIDDIAF